MALDSKTVRLDLKPGVNRQSTRYAEEGGWYACDKIRFRDGRPESIKGWQKYTTNSMAGTARDLIAWEDLQGLEYLGFGTEHLLYLNYGGTNYDITPVVSTFTSTNIVHTSAGSTRVIVSSNSHPIVSTAYTAFSSMAATAGGNIFLDGTYLCSAINANSFAVEVTTAAVATSTSAGGSLTVKFLLPSGASVAYPAYGWGAGTWGTARSGGGGWGVPASSGAVAINVRTWTLDNWGEQLVANPSGNKIYNWTPSDTAVRATEISAAPSLVDAIVVDADNRRLLALGCSDQVTGDYDPLLIRWSDTENYDVWTAAVTNAAGAQRLGVGSYIQGGIRTRNGLLIGTDFSAHLMQPSGDGFVYNIRTLGTNCGWISRHAAVDFNGKAVWMGHHNFYVFDGGLKPLDCTLQRYVFDDINWDQRAKVYAGTNAEFFEVWWFYPSANSTECDRYVKYNIKDNAWDYGTFDRSTWVDRSFYPYPIATGSDGYIYYHDIVSVFTGDGQPYQSFIESSDFDLADGGQIMFIDRIIPDFGFEGNMPQTLLYLTTKNYPGGQEVVKGPYPVSESTTKVNVRGRGRQARIRVESSTVPTYWRLGAMRVDLKPDGGR